MSLKRSETSLTQASCGGDGVPTSFLPFRVAQVHTALTAIYSVLSCLRVHERIFNRSHCISTHTLPFGSTPTPLISGLLFRHSASEWLCHSHTHTHCVFSGSLLLNSAITLLQECFSALFLEGVLHSNQKISPKVILKVTIF